jgi:hypothetical protein
MLEFVQLNILFPWSIGSRYLIYHLKNKIFIIIPFPTNQLHPLKESLPKEVPRTTPCNSAHACLTDDFRPPPIHIYSQQPSSTLHFRHEDTSSVKISS